MLKPKRYGHIDGCLNYVSSAWPVRSVGQDVSSNERINHDKNTQIVCTYCYSKQIYGHLQRGPYTGPCGPNCFATVCIGLSAGSDAFFLNPRQSGGFAGVWTAAMPVFDDRIPPKYPVRLPRAFHRTLASLTAPHLCQPRACNGPH